MNKVSFSQLLVALIMVLILSACQRSASPGAVASPTNGELPFPIATQPSVMIDIISGTQTAIAAGTGIPDFDTPTPEASETPETTPTVTMAAIATATPGRPATYTLQKGEFPYCIARRFNVEVADLLNLNGMTTKTVVSEGTVLKIPQSGSWSQGARALKPHPDQYTVKSGDTIYTIACLYGDVDPNAIIAANNLESPYTLTVGKVLQIP